VKLKYYQAPSKTESVYKGPAMVAFNPAIQRAFEILELLDRSHRGWNISDIARKLKIPKSSAHVFIRTLEKVGYVTKKPNGREYYLGLKSSALGDGFLKLLNLSDSSLAQVKKLAQQTALTVHLAVLEDGQAVYVHKVDGQGMVPFATWVGKRTNLHCTAVGKVLLAYSRSDSIDCFLSRNPLARYTPYTITSSAAFRNELQRVRQMGHALDDQEEEINVRCVGVPVFNRYKKCVAALGTTGIVNQIPENRAALLAYMESAAASISETLTD
jgi:DNA-binding IclR family transcriptional regulator